MLPAEILRQILTSPLERAVRWYRELEDAPAEIRAELGRKDRFYLLVRLLGKYYAAHPWIYARAREVQANPDGYIDLWARGHMKSLLITYAGSIQEILNNPEITIGLFSHVRPVAKAFLKQIKHDFERNEELKELYPDVLWAEPRKDAPTWSLDDGIIVKRSGNPKEATIEAWGMVDGQPTSKHFALRVYDDVVTRESVTTAEQIQKTTDAWELSQNLGMPGGESRSWHIGTRYSYADTYQTLLNRGAVIPRIYPATHDGTMHGKPVFLAASEWEKKKRDESTYTIACQQLQNPLSGANTAFREEWLRRYEIRPLTLNVAILCDPASSKNKDSCRTAFAVLGIDHAGNKYLLDGAAHRMSLTERWTMLKTLRAKWIRQPGVQVVRVGYERYGMQSDVEHFREMQRIEKQHAFHIEELNWPREGPGSKDDRIQRLEPDLRNWRFFLPYEGEPTRLQRDAIQSGQGFLVAKPIVRLDEDKRAYNLCDYLIHSEYLMFPATTAKDLLDAMSRIYDMGMSPPVIRAPGELEPEPEGVF